MPYLMLFLSGSFSALASILLRYAGQIPLATVGLLTLPNMLRIGAILAYGAGFVLYALALKRIELSIAYPIMVGITILEILIYGLLGGDSISLRSTLGAALIMSGILLIYSQ